MKLLASFLMLACIVTASVAHARSARSMMEAAESASAWLECLDEKNYEESWNQASAVFQAVVSLEEWKVAVAPVRESIGPVVSRKLKSAEFYDTIDGAPDGEYITLEFETDFAKKPGSIERVTPMKTEDGTWRVAGYYIVK